MRLDRQYIRTQLMAQYITKKFRLIKQEYICRGAGKGIQPA
ncbi:hypothetical protein [Bacillus sp. 2CMS4F]|nr:hypothetical protein [Bacillus sp. 2CMS4F]